MSVVLRLVVKRQRL